ncbi:hypothetical protein GCM10009535_35950 [Streptomyces thermocarboxydovorans]|uniref:Uncharacterized protein n=1 Tax=Streptomyces thermocarboxydovorans TaxID=59298 RepID=A0ABN1HJQ4_9ACTN
MVLVTPGRLCPCGTICHLAGHPGVQVRGDPPLQARTSPETDMKKPGPAPGGKSAEARLGSPGAGGGLCVGTWFSGP